MTALRSVEIRQGAAVLRQRFGQEAVTEQHYTATKIINMPDGPVPYIQDWYARPAAEVEAVLISLAERLPGIIEATGIAASDLQHIDISVDLDRRTIRGGQRWNTGQGPYTEDFKPARRDAIATAI